MRRFALSACVLSAVASFPGCTGGGAAAGLPSGRQVVVNSDRAFRTIRCENTTEGITAVIGPRKVVVEPTEVKVDGAPVATIPHGARTVAVTEFEGQLIVQADGTRVYDAKF